MPKTETSPESPLSEREREVLLAASRGFTVQTTAALLNMTPSTVRAHRANISRKLGSGNETTSMTAAVAVALRAGWIR